jgi:ABC-2 type transport system permease protein
MRLLPPALWLLIGLRNRARLRRIARDLKTLRGASVYIFGVGVTGLLIVPFLHGDLAQTPQDPEALLRIWQSGLLTIVLVGQIKALGERAIYFAPSEVDFLFPAPFSRRELLAYRVISGLSGILLTALVFSLAFIPFGGIWPAVLIGAFLSFLMINLLSMCLAVVRETLEEQAFSAARRVALLSVLGLIAASIGYGLHAEAAQGPAAVLRVTYGTWGMRLLLAPFLPFARVVTATSIDGATIGWAALCLLISGGLFAALMRLDANYLETAAEIGRRVYSRVQRVRAGRLQFSPTTARYRLPLLPRLRGAGTVAWWQLTAALRGLHMLAELAVLVLVVSGGIYLTSRAAAPNSGEDLVLLGYLAFWTTVIISYLLRFDFRAGIEHIPSLKVLPVPSWAICLGQLVTPVLITTLFQLVFAAVPLRSGNQLPLVLTVAFAVPINTVWYAVENISFLLYPIGLGGRGPGDFQFIGRQMLLLFARLLALGLTVAVAAAIAEGLLALGVASPLWRLAAAWLTLVLNASAMIGLLALVFRRFDPSRQTAES